VKILFFGLVCIKKGVGMSLIDVNLDKCIKCGLCVKVCPLGIIETGADCFPESFWEGCIACGHCVAVCPTAAIDNKLAPLENQRPRDKANDITSKQAEEFLRSRRSIRWFKDKAPSNEEIEKVLDIARYAPTGKNTQGISYLVVKDKKILSEITRVIVDFMEEFTKKLEDPSAIIQAQNRIEKYRKHKKDIVLLGAPILILALGNKNNRFKKNSSDLAMSYAQLYAPTIGLGTCWAGIFEAAASSGYEPLMKMLNISDEKEITAATMLGYPQYEHQRLVDRNPAVIEWLK